MTTKICACFVVGYAHCQHSSPTNDALTCVLSGCLTAASTSAKYFLVISPRIAVSFFEASRAALNSLALCLELSLQLCDTRGV